MANTTLGQFEEPDDREEQPSPPAPLPEERGDERAKAAEILPAEYQLLFEQYCRFLETCPHLAEQQARLNYLDLLVARVLVRDMQQLQANQLRQLGAAEVRMQFMAQELLNLKARLGEMNSSD